MSKQESRAARPPLHRRLWRDWVRPLIVVIVVLSSFRSAVADWHDVPTQSMEPTILVGDRVAVIRNQLFVNGVPAHRFFVEHLDRGSHAILLRPSRGAPRSFDEVTVPAGRYLVMGDSRAFGVAISFDRDASYRPRWRRWFRGLE